MSWQTNHHWFRLQLVTWTASIQILWTNAGILLIGPLAIDFSEILIEIYTFSLTKIHWKRSFAKCCSFHLSLNVLTGWHHSKLLMKSHTITQHLQVLTHWGRDKMAAIFQTTFSNGFSWMKMYEFRLTFHWSLFLEVKLTIFQHWFR